MYEKSSDYCFKSKEKMVILIDFADSLQRVQKKQGNKVETIYLRDKKINFCKGCSVCRTTHRCVQDDDMAEILDKVVKADVIVL